MAVRIIMETFDDFQTILKNIWKDRCEKVIEWGKDNGITIRAKKKKYIKIKFANRSQHNQDGIYYGEVDYESTKHKICKDKRMAVRIIMETFDDFQTILKNIWKDRCEKVIEWGKDNGITIRAKKKKYIKIKFANRSQHNQDGMFIMGEKSDEEKEYLKEKQKIKKEKIDDIFLKSNKYNGYNLYKIKIDRNTTNYPYEFQLIIREVEMDPDTQTFLNMCHSGTMIIITDGFLGKMIICKTQFLASKVS
ncbi:hypothetical protein Glove_428g37 [Diversispora epigaea]|uniref:Uncharacterized protein n=1 Tax=Diversispora epigaea TaxID=1348612 RepID=A0A397GVF5_9GLOM|nr:hypothetical protein Glove_428g37 [Diversispora epigaea]